MIRVALFTLQSRSDKPNIKCIYKFKSDIDKHYMQDYNHYIMTQNENLNLSNKLHVIRMVDSGITLQGTTNQFDIDLSIVTNILQSRDQLETVHKSTSRHKNLALRDKLRVIHLMEIHKHNKTKLAGICSISRQSVRNIWDDRNILPENEKNSSFLDARRPLNATYPVIDARVINFISYARSQRLPVTSSHVQQYARNAAANEGINKFKAVNEWLEKFLHRSSIHPSFRMHGESGNTQVSGTDNRMEEIRGILSICELRNIYNVDDSANLY